MDTYQNNQYVKLALVVDDSKVQCQVLSVLLKEENYQVIVAHNGLEAIAKYKDYQPDLILMDISMPIMNGFSATRKIKSLSESNLCPLIFITSDDTEQAYIDSIDAGGDGILVRPFSPQIFKSKIKSLQRISDLYRQVKSLQQEQQKDAELAERLMSGVIESRNFALDKIGMIKQPAALFSGDIQLTALSPNGDLNVMLGDFTGHGLRSSIGAIPLAETFRAMTRKGFSLFEIIIQINKQLYTLLPSDLFLGAAFVSVSEHDKSAYIFNAGLPDIYIMSSDGSVRNKISSTHPPMGVLPELFKGTNLTVLSVEKDERIELISDGILEVRNDKGNMFECERLEESLKKGIVENNVSSIVLSDVIKFCQNMPQEDDISLIDIPCSGWLSSKDNHEATLMKNEDKSIAHDYENGACAWEWRLKLSGSRLTKINPIPIALNQITEIEGNSEHWQNLYTILTELFINALDHGVLGLGSELKSTAQGFVLYFNEREARLAKLDKGFVDIKLSYYPIALGGRIKIYISDSGKGFKYIKSEHREINNQLYGRGIMMLNQLCESLVYKNNGSTVEASYAWKV
ncbi:SpoIIE family protein phosphatase [Pseudocolwellia agarivorans]|uniref:SpoIIE family protein phosphatase n=1 Tax=Pseudocolwellia agarivorans TaxID=1911682 RepID=UPI000985F274|nr:SpoIIE family protein phosphatase [Pseudocolwellia agarivorans]